MDFCYDAHMFRVKRVPMAPVALLVAWMVLRSVLAFSGALSYEASALANAAVIIALGAWITFRGYREYKKGEAYRQQAMMRLAIGLLMMATYLPELMHEARISL